MSALAYYLAIAAVVWCAVACVLGLALGCWLRRWEREEMRRREILKRFEEE